MDRVEFINPQGSGANAYYRNTAPKKKSRKSLLIIIVLLVLVILGGFGVYFVYNDNDGYSYGGGEPYIGILHVEGTIQGDSATADTYQHDWLLQHIEYMKKDPSNQGIMLYVNSPGGSVYQADELYLELMEYKEKTNRPLYAYFGQQAASGGYYIAAGADKITANRNSNTGSIGVYMGPLIDVSTLLENLGISAEMITAGENKAMGSGFEPLTDQQRAIYQSYVDEAYQQFVEIVANGRNMDIETVKVLADGRMYTALQAKENGLIDEVSDFDTAKRAMLLETELECSFIDIKYAPQISMMDMLFSLQDTIREASASGKISEAESVLKLREEYSNFNVQYLAQ